MSKIFIKMLSLCAIITISQQTLATENREAREHHRVYAKALLDPSSSETLHKLVTDTLQSISDNDSQFWKVIQQNDFHMTLNNLPSLYGSKALADVTNANVREYRKQEFDKRLDVITKELMDIPFIISGISSNYGRADRDRRFLVLELKPQYVNQKQKKNTRNIIEDKPHISLVVAETSDSRQTNNLLSFHNRLENWIKSTPESERKIFFNRATTCYRDDNYEITICSSKTNKKK